MKPMQCLGKANLSSHLLPLYLRLTCGGGVRLLPTLSSDGQAKRYSLPNTNKQNFYAEARFYQICGKIDKNGILQVLTDLHIH